MDPITLITLATSLVKATGLDRYIGNKLGGDKGADIAEKVVNVAQVVTGASDPDEALARINASAQYTQELRLRLLQMENEAAERELTDRADARAMQMAALAQDDKFSKRFVYLFAIAWSIFAMGYIVGITMFDIPQSNVRFADTILGFLLGTVISVIISFFFGSSRQSQSKDAAVEALSQHLTNKGYKV